jgi:hypothetical protein
MRAPPLSPRGYLVLRTVLVADTVLLLVVAGLLAGYMEWPAWLVGAAAACVLAGMSLGAARWADRLYEHGR